jgi:lipopolysaccharide transport system ATP-binding protein
MTQPAIRIKNLSKVYYSYAKPRYRLQEMMKPILGKLHPRFDRNYADEFWALKDINLEIPKGSAFGIIGRNGAGKSTLLQIIAGTLTPTTGDVEVNGRVNALLELGSGFNPEFTGRENIFMNGSILGFSKEEIQNKFQEIHDFSEIGKFIDQPVKTYSSGMFVRLAFSVQAMLEPEILIVDEALSVGDIFFQQKCHKLIEKLLESGNTTFLFVTHDMGSIEKYCKDAMVLHEGRALFIGDKKTAILKYYRPDQDVKALKDLRKDNQDSEYKFLSEYVQIGNSQDVILENVFITNPEDNSKTPRIPVGIDFSVTVIYRILRKIENPVVDITIKDYRGIPIYSTHSLLLGNKVEPIHSDTVILSSTFAFKNFINMGKYVVSAGISNWKSSHSYLTGGIPDSSDQEFIASFENIMELNVIENPLLETRFHGLVDLKPEFSYKMGE